MNVELSWNVWRGKHDRAWIWLPELLALVVSASCGSLPKTHYYTLQLPAPPAPVDPRTDFILGVERFGAAETLRDDRIVYYESSTQLNYYEYHRWGSDPAGMLEELTVRKLDRAGVFKEVRRLPSRAHVDYVLRGQVLNFEEVDFEGGVQGRVTLELTLVRWSDGFTVWSETRMVERPAEGQGVAGVVRALNASSEQLLSEALPGLMARMDSEVAQSSAPSQSH
ncbi:MAG: membrane integrity-associated transporter subunit PqiC [Acidobacteria bacterium]|nr:membrane integrity-associated transporter subunit PqiC [Acidobacteriota bacterium]